MALPGNRSDRLLNRWHNGWLFQFIREHADGLQLPDEFICEILVGNRGPIKVNFDRFRRGNDSFMPFENGFGDRAGIANGDNFTIDSVFHKLLVPVFFVITTGSPQAIASWVV